MDVRFDYWLCFISLKETWKKSIFHLLICLLVAKHKLGLDILGDSLVGPDGFMSVWPSYRVTLIRVHHLSACYLFRPYMFVQLLSLIQNLFFFLCFLVSLNLEVYWLIATLEERRKQQISLFVLNSLNH